MPKRLQARTSAQDQTEAKQERDEHQHEGASSDFPIRDVAA